MGKLRDSLDNVRKLIEGLQKSTTTYCRRLSELSKQADTFRRGGDAGVSELVIYVKEKLKKKNIPFEKVKKAQLKTLTDANIKNYLAGFEFMVNETAKFLPEFKAVADDKAIDNTLDKLDPLLADVEGQIRKKKKKLLQSKKYKVKITNYEGTLKSLRQVIRECKEDMAEFRQLEPPSAARLRAQFGFTENSTLEQVEGGMKPSTAQAYQELNSFLLKLHQSASDLRFEQEFAKHVNDVKEMVNNALEMEKEGGAE